MFDVVSGEHPNPIHRIQESKFSINLESGTN